MNKSLEIFSWKKKKKKLKFSLNIAISIIYFCTGNLHWIFDWKQAKLELKSMQNALTALTNHIMQRNFHVFVQEMIDYEHRVLVLTNFHIMTSWYSICFENFIIFSMISSNILSRGGWNFS